MPWRLILFAVFLVLLVLFVGFNLENTCAVNLIFHTFQDVPVFISILLSFALGILLMLPFTVGKNQKNLQYQEPVYREPTPKKKSRAAERAAAKAEKLRAARPAEPEKPVATPINED